MPRRAATSEAPDDIKVKTESIRVKQEKLRNKGKRRANTPEEEPEEEDAEGETDEEARGEQEEETPRGSKRLRLNGEGDSRPSSNGHGSQQVPKMKTLPRDTDGYA
jgi:structural maintenance of chromosomes protein 5